MIIVSLLLLMLILRGDEVGRLCSVMVIVVEHVQNEL